jgi:hypothetical protein
MTRAKTKTLLHPQLHTQHRVDLFANPSSQLANLEQIFPLGTKSPVILKATRNSTDAMRQPTASIRP